MHLIRKNSTIDEILNSLQNFIDYLSNYFPGKLNNTDFKKYVTALEEINKGNINDDNLRYLPIIHKFIFLYEFIQENSYIQHNTDNFKLKLKELIKRNGTLSLEQDGEQKYNRELFEFSMAARFAKCFSYLTNEKNEKIIDISDDCDIIVQNKIGIECKYISSADKVRERLFEGVEQINQRIMDSKIEYSLIALDLSYIIHTTTNYNGIMDIREDFPNKEKMLITVRQQYQDLITQEMQKIVMRFLNDLWNSKNIKIKPNAVIFQSYNYTFIEYKDELIPVFYRTLDSAINPRISKENALYIQKIISNLATGI